MDSHVIEVLFNVFVGTDKGGARKDNRDYAFASIKNGFTSGIGLCEEKTGKDVKFSKKVDFRMSSRGNPLIVRKRICTMEEIDDKIATLK